MLSPLSSVTIVGRAADIAEASNADNSETTPSTRNINQNRIPLGPRLMVSLDASFSSLMIVDMI